MASKAMQQGNAEFVDELYENALENYSQAIQEGAGAAGYASRAQVQLKLGNYMEAAEDAGKAIELDDKMAKAHLRKAIALFYMDEFETAKSFLTAGLKLDPDNPAYKLWLRKCDAEIEEEDAMEDVEIEETKPAVMAAPPPAPSPAAQEIKENQPLAPCATEPMTRKYRHQWYQTQSHTYVEVFAKKLTSDRTFVHMEKNRLEIRTKESPTDDVPDYELLLDLSEDITPEESRFTILSTKLEVKMKKSILGRNWVSLEVGGKSLEEEESRQYPTSAKRTVDWSKLEADVKQDEDNEHEEGDAAVQKLFRKIYADADEDTRRAMNKSFQESKGTCLSTNWDEVGQKTISPSPPDGAAD